MDEAIFMRRAIELALDQVQKPGGEPFGAVVVRDGRIIGEGWNQMAATGDPTAHAEIVAIRRACAHIGGSDLDGCDLFTSCEPCPMCLGAIYCARLRRIYYASTIADAARAGFDDEFLYRQIALPRQQRRIPSIQVEDTGAGRAFELWLARSQSP